jgi:hypothetical protein
LNAHRCMAGRCTVGVPLLGAGRKVVDETSIEDV